MTDAFTGPGFTNDDVQSALERNNLHFHVKSFGEIANKAADLVAEGKVVGWFQGRMEWGPRALGHRSIIADPRRVDMKDTLNARIKNRESFRQSLQTEKLVFPVVFRHGGVAENFSGIPRPTTVTYTSSPAAAWRAITPPQPSTSSSG